jgi:uncharacterized membrane protein YqjE
MNFEELKNSWQTQPLNTDMKIRDFKIAFDSKWQKHQRKVLKTNVCMSLGFLSAMTVNAWVYLSFKDQYDWPFQASLITSTLLMIIFAAISWRSYGFKKENFEASSRDFIHYQMEKINWQRKVIAQYFWVYIVLLWLALILYIWEITSGGTEIFRYSALLISSTFLWLLSFREARTQRKKLAFLDAMKSDLQDLFN